MKRIFIAVKVTPEAELLKAAATLKALLASESIKWTDMINTHLTLAFLGDTEESRIGSVAGMLQERCAGFKEFGFRIEGTGIFKNYRDPRVIWAGITSAERLVVLGGIINSGLTENGFRVEERAFKPHLTLGRIRTVKNIDHLREVVEKYRETVFQTVTVNEVILFESILRQTGPLYKPLGKFSLL